VKKPRITAKQEGGDDGYCYAVRIDGKLYVNGLTRREVPYYKERALEKWKEDNGRQSSEDGQQAPERGRSG